jgi:hypothetical protein
MFTGGFVPQGDEALRDLEDLWLPCAGEPELIVTLACMMDEGTPFLRANVDWNASVAAGNAVVRYQLADELKVYLAAATARKIVSLGVV